MAGKDLVDRFAEIFARDGDVIAGTALVKLAAINEAEICIEEEDIRCAGCFKGLCDFLRFVVEIWEAEVHRDGLML